MNESASALGLYRCGCDHPANALFSTFSSTILSLLGTWGVTPTYIAATGAEYSGKYFRFGSRAHDRLVHSGFERINALSIAVTPPGSTKPSYDSVVSASCGYVEAIRELLVCIVVNERYVALYSPAYEQMLLSLVAIYRWDFGYGFSSSVEDQPDFHLLGIDNGRLSPGEYDSLCKWYAATGDARKVFLRNIYPYNFLNDAQLSAQVSEGISLREFAQSQSGSSLTRVTDDGLYLWRVPESEVIRLRKLLLGSPAVIS